MRLKNKKTGEIGNLKPYGGDEKIWVWIDNKSKPEYRYNSLAELNEEWEDVPEEPKEYWYISDFGYVFNHEINNKSVKSTIEEMKSIGNYFLSREEAEKAAEKLKAWKRLKDKGFINEQVFTMNLNWCNPDDDDWKAFKVLFGGEE